MGSFAGLSTLHWPFFPFHSHHERCAQISKICMCVCHHAFAKNKISLTRSKISCFHTFHLSSKLLHVPHASSQVSDQSHPDRAGVLELHSPFALASLLILLIRLVSLSILEPLEPSLSCICSFSAPCQRTSFPLLSSALSWVSATPKCSLYPNVCCLPFRVQ